MEDGTPGTEIARYADVAMYEAAPAVDKVAGNGTLLPKVTLVSMTRSPLRTMAAAAQLYRGVVVHDPQEVSREVAMAWWDDMTRTKLQAPLEFIDFHFLLENVSRAFTHQLVRQRTGVYVQESQRFAVKEDARWAVHMPPSIAALPEDHPARRDWEDGIRGIAKRYLRLVHNGIPAEDARGLLPTNILTRVHYKTNLRNLAEHAGMRLCTQAQFEWRSVWAGIISEIRNYGNRQDITTGAFSNGDAWEFKAIASLFRPVCYRTGKCEFMAETDRFCSIRERVNAFHAEGVSPSEWENEKWEPTIRISPAEWLLDPAAARTRNPHWRDSQQLSQPSPSTTESLPHEPPSPPSTPSPESAELPEPPEPEHLVTPVESAGSSSPSPEESR